MKEGEGAGGTARSMARNTAAMMVSQVITWTATFALIIHLPRELGAANYGKLGFSTAFMAMFALFIDFGTTTLITREVARDRKRAASYLTNVLVLKLVTAVIAYVGVMATAVLLKRPPDIIHLLYIFGINMVLDSLSRSLDGILQGFEKVSYLAWGEVMDKVVGTAIILVLLARGYGLVEVAWSMTGIGVLRLVRNGTWALRLACPRMGLLRLSEMRYLMAASMPFFLYAVFAKVYDKVDVTMLGLMTRDEVVGWYGAAYRLFGSLFFVPHIFYTVAFPVLSRLSSGDATVFRHALHRGFALICAAAVGMSVMTFVLAGPLVDALYTQEKFPGTAPALRVLAIALGIQYLNTIFVMALQTTDRQSRWTRAGAVAAVVNPAVNYLLIPILGHLGAAVTTVLTEATLMAMAVRACPPGLWDASQLRILARAGVAGAVLAGALLLGLHWGLVPALLLGAPVYLLATVRLRVIAPEDVALMGSMGRQMCASVKLPFRR